MKERTLRLELEVMQATRRQLALELEAGESTRTRAARDAARAACAAANAERDVLEAALQPLRARDVELTWTCYQRERALDRPLSALPWGLTAAPLLFVAWLILSRFDPRTAPLALFTCAFGLGWLAGGPLLGRLDFPTVRRAAVGTLRTLFNFSGVVTSLALLISGPVLWIVSVFLPRPMHEPMGLIAGAALGGAFLVSRHHLRLGTRDDDWRPLTGSLALMGLSFAALRLPELASRDHVIGTAALFTLFVPLTGLFWTRRGPHSAAAPLARASAILASAWTACGVTFAGEVALGFSAVACAMLGFVLAGSIEDREAQLFNTVALVGGLAVLLG